VLDAVVEARRARCALAQQQRRATHLIFSRASEVRGIALDSGTADRKDRSMIIIIECEQ
jgi:hypothetical protein